MNRLMWIAIPYIIHLKGLTYGPEKPKEIQTQPRASHAWKIKILNSSSDYQS